MKGENIFRVISVTLIISFIILYVSQATGYYEVDNSKKTAMTNEAIEKYEKDIREGKKIDLKDYTEEEKSYSNNISKLTSGVSKTIEGSFNYIMNSIFEEMDKAIKENKK